MKPFASYTTLGFLSLLSAAVQAQGALPQPSQTPPAPPGAAAPPSTPPSAAPTPAPPSAGGLRAPAPMDPNIGRGSDTRRHLDDSKNSDSGRGLTWFYLDVEGGFEHIGLETFSVDESNLTAGFTTEEASGGFVGAGLGLRLLYFTIGPRGRFAKFDKWNKLSLGGELGFRFPIGIVEPYLTVGGGYVAVGGLSADNQLDALSQQDLTIVSDHIDIDGGYARIVAGLDLFPLDFLSIGVGASWDIMGLTRKGVSLQSLDPNTVKNLSDARKTALAADGSGWGSSLNLGARVGLHF